MKSLSHIACAVRASSTLKVDALFKQMKEEKKDVIGFGAGEPDFDTPNNVTNAAINSIKEGKTRYTPASGVFALRQAVANRLLSDCGVNYDAKQIVVASGAKHSIFVALQVLLNPGDEVILPAPYWVTYYEAIRMAGGIPVTISASESDGFKITSDQFKAAITDKTKLFIFNNPCNPTGVLYEKEEMSELADLCVKHDLYVLSDEIYYRLVYDGKKFTSFAALGEEVKERTIIINGVSKTYAMTGWRIGYSASDVRLANIMGNYLSHSTSSPSTISQFAAVEALNGSQESIFAMRDVFQERRDYVLDCINSIDGLSANKPNGAFYVMLNIEKQIGRTLGGVKINNSDDFSLSLLSDSLVAVVSCTDFGCDNFVRITYATSMDSIKEGLSRIKRFVE